MINRPLISVIIPCYNVEGYIEKCIESIFKNNYEALELIVINDGSKDNTLKLLETIKRRYPTKKILLINQKNKGLSESRNIGVELATGDFVMFIDSDDWISEVYFDQFVSKSANDVDLVVASYTREFEKVAVPRKLNLNNIKEARFIKRRLIGLIDEELRDPSQADSIVTVWAKLYKKTILMNNNVRFISTKILGSSEDLLFNLHYLESCNSVFVLDKPLYHYRKNNSTSFTSNYKPDLFDKWQILFQKINETFEQSESELKEALNNRICLSIIGLGLNEIGNPGGMSLGINKLKIYLNDPQYKAAFGVLKFKNFPFHWYMFFFFAKYKMTFCLYMMLKIMNSILKK